MDSRVSLTPFFQYTQACPSHGRLTFVAIVNVKFPSASVSVVTLALVSVIKGGGYRLVHVTIHWFRVDWYSSVFACDENIGVVSVGSNVTITIGYVFLRVAQSLYSL